MKNNFTRIAAVICLSFFMATITGQEPAKKTQNPIKANPAEKPVFQVPEILTPETEAPEFLTPEIDGPLTDVNLLLLINEAQPSQIIVYDATGKWLSDIREVKINVDLANAGITANCVLWKGPIRPTQPKTMMATIKEIKSVAAEAFADKLLQLNNN